MEEISSKVEQIKQAKQTELLIEPQSESVLCDDCIVQATEPQQICSSQTHAVYRLVESCNDPVHVLIRFRQYSSWVNGLVLFQRPEVVSAFSAVGLVPPLLNIVEVLFFKQTLDLQST